jgi:protein involved in polysaccharide export with SLBB domain
MIETYKNNKAPVVLVLIVSLLSACATVEQLDPSPEVLRSTLEVGDEVRITTVSGEEYEFTVESLDESSISGEGNVVSYADIAEIEAARVSDAESIAAVAVGGAALWYFIIAPLVALISLASISG